MDKRGVKTKNTLDKKKKEEKSTLDETRQKKMKYWLDPVRYMKNSIRNTILNLGAFTEREAVLDRVTRPMENNG